MENRSQTDFILESREHVQVLERSMLALEHALGGRQICDCIDAGLRAIHSLKGNAGFLGFRTVQRLAHATESVLENYRNQPTPPPSSVVQTLLLANDRIAAMLEDLEHSDAHDISQLILKLETNTGLRTLDFQLVLPTPPKSVISTLDSLCSHATLNNVRISELDLSKSILPTEQNQLDCVLLEGDLKTDCTEFEFQKRFALPGLSFASNDQSQLVLSATNLTQLDQEVSDREGDLVYEPVSLTDGVPKHPIVFDPTPRLTLPPQLPYLDSLAPAESNATNPPEQPDALATSPRNMSPPRNTDVVGKPFDRSNALRTENPEASPKSALKEDAVPSASDRPTSLRINIDLLDRLMNLVSELTLVRNQSLLTFGEVEGTPRAVMQRLNTVTSELQDAILKTRMQPVGNLFGRFPRMVRDLARQLGKQVEIVMVGQEVELDKTVLEQLSDPLTHLIRNSIDHGLETSDERIELGKSPVGQVILSATAADGQVIIGIRDDGRGIDPSAVRAKVVALGLRTESELQKISSKELFSYILLPGFSTAKKLSDVSGRGVGMDVVKTNVERLEGSLTIDSAPNVGTTITLRVPLTLAIIPCLIVTVGDQRFAVPQRGLEEIVCLYPGGRAAIEHSYDTELYRLREVLLPVVRLAEVLHRATPFSATTKAEILASYAPALRNPSLIEYILVLRTGGRKFGLLVDDVRGTEEVVVKPMHPSLKKIGIFAGATLMGDGRVALIANIDGIAEHADCYGIEPPTTSSVQRNPTEVHRVLLFEYGAKEMFALPLVQVRRIESISTECIEQVGDQEFITIDGVATRIVRLDRYLNVSECQCSPSMHLLLPKFVTEPMGILVSRIVDTESLSIALQQASVEDPGILGTAIIRDRLTLFIDTQYLREKIFGRQLDEPAIPVVDQSGFLTSQLNDPSRMRQNSTPAITSKAPRILLVDDTPFFREVVKRYFERIGLHVVTAVDGNDGLRQLATQPFDLVVSDIEMPNLDGWGFCREARTQGYTTPFLALTSLSKSEYLSKACECGFDGFEEKLDHDRLIESVREMLGLAASEVPHAS